MSNLKLKMPTRQTLTGRASTIKNSANNGILPQIKPSDDDNQFIERLLGTRPYSGKTYFNCAYCGKGAGTETDHIRPLIVNGEPTGYIHEISNLIPSCRDCNTDKGNYSIDEFYELQKVKARLSEDEILSRKLVVNEYLEYFENKYAVIQLDIPSILGEKWDRYQGVINNIIGSLREGQELFNEIKSDLKKYYDENECELRAREEN